MPEANETEFNTTEFNAEPDQTTTPQAIIGSYSAVWAGGTIGGGTL
jgi:hypothetical protein